LKKDSFRERLYRFMYGRYGMDELGKLLIITYFVFVIANIFINSIYFYIISLVIALLFTLRVFSRAVHVRKKENDRYLKIRKDIKNFFVLQKSRFKDRKTHIYRRCPSCGAVLRLLRRKEKGENSVKCPRCSHSFKVR